MTSVAKGFIQKYKIDYLETFSLVAKMNTIKVIFAIVVKGRKMFQLDIKNAFLNGDLHREVYISMPPKYEKVEKCCRLWIILYRLRKPPRM